MQQFSRKYPNEAASGAMQPRKQQQQLPSFRVWQARQLWSRDVLFGCVLALILLLYYSKTVPQLCLQGPLSCPLQEQQQQHGKQHAAAQQLLWRIICGNKPPELQDSSSSSSNKLQQCDTTGSDVQPPAVGLGGKAAGSGKHPALQQAAWLAAAAAAKLARPLVALMQVSDAYSLLLTM